MATYNAELGMWRAGNGQMYSSQQEAQAAEQGAAPQSTPSAGNSDQEFAANWGKPVASIGQILTPEQIQQQQQQLSASRASRAEDQRLASVPYGTPVTQGGTANVHGLSYETGSTAYTPGTPGGTTPRYNQVDVINGGAGAQGGASGGGINVGSMNDANQAGVTADQAQIQADKQALIDKWAGVKWDDTQNQESRDAEQNAAALNKQVYDKLAAYDPTQEAKTESDKALQNQMSIARSAGGGAAQKQAAMFQALQQAPQIQQQSAEDARTKREQLTRDALTASSQYGQVVSGTRGHDIQTQQSEGQLGVQLASGMTGVMQHAEDLTQNDMQFLGQARLALETEARGWAGLSEQEREAKVDEALKQAGLDQQWKEFKAGQKITGKDLFGALLTLGGEGIKAGATMGAL